MLPSSVIQAILKYFQEIHDISQSHLLFKLKEKLVALGVPEADISTVIDVLKTEDLLRACNTETLKTDHRRKTMFKNSFNYVEPVPICLGQNEAGKECFAQYVPIKQTIESLFHLESVREHTIKYTPVSHLGMFFEMYGMAVVLGRICCSRQKSRHLV